jgi:hypothetical protein
LDSFARWADDGIRRREEYGSVAKRRWEKTTETLTGERAVGGRYSCYRLSKNEGIHNERNARRKNGGDDASWTDR